MVISIMFALVILVCVVVKNRKFSIVSMIAMFSVIAVVLLFGFRFTAIETVPGNANEVGSYDTVYGKALLYEDEDQRTFGLAKVKQSFGFLHRYAGGTNGYYVEEQMPFQAAGYGSNEDDGFLVGVKTATPEIKYIVVGDHFDELHPSESYNFTMETVNDHLDMYEFKEVDDNYAFFVLDEYTEETWTIRALDEEGHLVADKLFGNDVRGVDW
ncbi:hypothetical protein LGQ02_01440 [Bacillus shivajii]|uniref:hypothetical protein n=1 Tax=Bacillus shivajii TaxID=1983719 RepID=UPI001CFA135C|nr:hypothetical protein [Bacillus shivajii]UCZ53493.1 hypothetical protein LGQ02_01440 [Bacillus shivajii]